MTKNQLQFHSNQETMRANRAQEELARMRDAETARSNLASEALKSDQNAETVKHNRAQESIGRQDVQAKRYAAELKLMGDVTKTVGSMASRGRKTTGGKPSNTNASTSIKKNGSGTFTNSKGKKGK